MLIISVQFIFKAEDTTERGAGGGASGAGGGASGAATGRGWVSAFHMHAHT